MSLDLFQWHGIFPINGYIKKGRTMRFEFVQACWPKVTNKELLMGCLLGHYQVFRNAEGEEVAYVYRWGWSGMGDFISLIANQPVNIKDFVTGGSFIPFDCAMHHDDGTLDMRGRPHQFVREDGLQGFFHGRPHSLPDAEAIHIVQVVEAERVRLLKEMGEWDEVCKILAQARKDRFDQ